MRSLTVVALAIGAIALLVGIQSTPTAQANVTLQDQPRLDGINIYFAESEGEASRFDRFDNGLSRFAGLLRQLGASLYTLEWHTGFPTDADLIVIAGPIYDLQPEQIARLWSYINNHGRLLLLSNPTPQNTGLFALMWADLGIGARNDQVVTETQGQPASESETPEPVAAPGLLSDFVTTRTNVYHAITAGLDGPLAFFGARSLLVDASIQGSIATPLIFSDNSFYGESAFSTYAQDGTFEYNIGSDTPRGLLVLAGAFENAKTGTRVVVIGDRDFATNGYGLLTSPPNSASFVYPTNVYFLLNSVTWLLEKEQVEMSFPTPGPTSTATITPSPTPTLEASPTAAQ